MAGRMLCVLCALQPTVNRANLLLLNSWISNRLPTGKVYEVAAMKQPSLADIKRHYVVKGRSLDAATEAALKEDPRPGARAILQAVARRRFENRAEGQRLRRLTRFEWALWDKGILHVAGVDEAGMSPLAGPVSASAVIFLPGARIPGVNDSKQLNVAERERLAAEIKQTSVA
jgi:ribonuclease HII